MSAAGWSVSTVWNVELSGRGGGWNLDIGPTIWAVKTPAAELVIVLDSQDSKTPHCILVLSTRGEAGWLNQQLLPARLPD